MMTFSETPESSDTRLEISGLVKGAAPGDVIRAFTDPELITAWWAAEAETDPQVGGLIEARWPSMGWTMGGTYTDIARHRVAFTWKWEHQPDLPTRTVVVTAIPETAGTRLELTHGEYSPSDTDERQGHVDGWLHFLPRLADLF